MSVLCLVEVTDAEGDELSLQALTFARRYAAGEPVEAVVFAGDTHGLGEHGVAAVHAVDAGDGYAPVAWACALAQLAERRGATAVVGPGSDRGQEVLAHLAALTDRVFAANCVEATPGDPAEVTRLRWGGSLLERARVHGPVKLFTVAPHVVEAEAAPGVEPAVESFTPELEEHDLVVRVSQRVDTSGGGISLAEAPVVVSGGRGVGSAEGFAPLEELASLLGGVVGCSRAVTSAGWRPHTDQVGQTGTKVAPELYIPCGISGATQHMAGCKGAKRILAINSDPEAPILASADYAVIGDLGEVVPAIVEAVKQAKS